MIRRLTATLLGAILVLAMSTPASAYNFFVPSRAFNNSSIADAELMVCYGWLSDAIYVNRSAVSAYLADTWGNAMVLAFGSNANCNVDGSNIQIMFASDMGQCTNLGTSHVAEATVPGGLYSIVQVRVNRNCHDAGKLDWSRPSVGTVDSTKVGIVSILVHEVGHALGLAHSTCCTGALMHTSGPDHCNFIGHNASLAEDDANGLDARYPGLTAIPRNWGTNGVCWE